jgi:hypothetical protein
MDPVAPQHGLTFSFAVPDKAEEHSGDKQHARRIPIEIIEETHGCGLSIRVPTSLRRVMSELSARPLLGAAKIV